MDSPILNGLNERQKEGVVNTDGPMLIIAGAGSGKTTVMTKKMAYLIQEKGVDPKKILGVTFTNKATNEMKERIVKLIGDDGYAIRIYTFHSFCIREILKNELYRLGYKRNFTIYDDDDSKKVITNILGKLSLNPKEFVPKVIYSIISKLKVEMIDSNSFLNMTPNSPLIDWDRALCLIEGVSSKYKKVLKEVYPRYEKLMKEANAIDFNDIINMTAILLYTYEDLREHYQDKFDYIIIDEYQDTNRGQYWLGTFLAERHKNISVVGDDKQSIYGFRGADIRNILDFEENYPNAKVVKLEQNYRSTKQILNAANQIIANNVNQKKIKLFTDKKGGDNIKFYTGYNDIEEANFVAGEILKRIKREGRKFSDFSILVRINANTRTFEESFIRNKIPYDIVKGLKFFERKEVKDIISYMRFLVNQEDRIAFDRLSTVPKRGIGKSALNKIDDFKDESKGTLWNALVNAETFLSGKAEKGIIKIKELIENAKDLIDKKTPLPAVIEYLYQESGLLEHFSLEDKAKDTNRVENIQQFLTFVWEFDEETEDATISDLLEKIALNSAVDNSDFNEDKVQIMTYHSSKGLEFPVVFLGGFEDGSIPYAKALNESGGLEEERRLCYVGITRAKEILYLTTCKSRRMFGTYTNPNVSRFIDEFDHTNLEKIRKSY